MGKDISSLIKDFSFLFKLIAFILCLLCVIMWSADLVGYSSSSYGNIVTTYHSKLVGDSNYDLIVVATAVYVLILGVFIIIYVIDNSKKLFELLFIGCGSILNIVSGIVELVYDINHSGNWAAFILGIGMIAAGVIMAIDFFLAIKK